MLTGFTAPIDAQALGDLIDDTGPATTVQVDGKLLDLSRFMHTVLVDVESILQEGRLHADALVLTNELALVKVRCALKEAARSGVLS